MINAKKLISKILITAALTCIPFSTAFAVKDTSISINRVGNHIELFIPHDAVTEMITNLPPSLTFICIQIPPNISRKFHMSSGELHISAQALREKDHGEGITLYINIHQLKNNKILILS